MAGVGFGTVLAPTPALPRKRERGHVTDAVTAGN